MTSKDRIYALVAASKITIRFLLLACITGAGYEDRAVAAGSEEAWVQRFDPTSTVLQEGNSVAADSTGNVAVTATQFIDNNEAFYTAKYSAATGAVLWEKTYDSGNGDDIPASVAMDSAGNVIVTGYRTNAGGFHDYYTIKYASADGAELWAKSYEGPNGGLDEAIKVVVDSADNVIVTGQSAGSGTKQDIQTLKYRASDGAVLNQWRYNSPFNRDDQPSDMTVDAEDNIVVVGEVNFGDEVWFYTGRYNGNGAPGAIHWEKVRDDLPSPSFYGALAVAVDSAGNVFTAGRIRREDITFEALTIKYAAADGAIVWDKFSEEAKLESANEPVDIAVDSDGNAILGVTLATNTGNSIGLIKYAAADGAILWGRETTPPGDRDSLTAVAVDPFDNVVAAGTSHNDLPVGASDDYYVLKLRDNGDFVFQDRRNGDNESGDDTVRALVVDGGGNIVVTGRSRKADEVQGNTFQMLTVKYGTSIVVEGFLIVTGDPVPGAGVPGSNVPEGAIFSVIGTPAVADTGDFAVRVGISAKKKKFEAILLQTAAGNQTLPAMEGDAAPGVSDANFKSFSDPVIAPNGRLAFEAKVGGVRGSEDSGVWTTAFNGTLQLALQTGNAVPGFGNETTLKQVSGISLRDGHLLSLVQLGGSGVNRRNDDALVGQTSPSAGTVLLRTGDDLTVDGETSSIGRLTVFTPAKSSAGHGRYHGTGRSVARVTLQDKRTVFLRLDHNGTIGSLLFTGQPATGIVDGAVWKTLGLPAIGSGGSNFALSGTLGDGDVKKSDSAVLVYSTNGTSFVRVAREGDVASDETGTLPSDGPTWNSFSDPLVNNQAGSIAFLATLDGKEVKGSNKTGLWFAKAGDVIRNVVRLGDKAPGADGVAGDAAFVDFVSVALPGGTNAGPIFLAKIKGPGVSGKENFGLWSVNGTTGQVRKLLGAGDLIGDARITRLTVLQAMPGVQGATRSFNSNGSAIVLLTLSDNRQALLNVHIP